MIDDSKREIPPELAREIGDLFQQVTKYRRGALPRHQLDFRTQPAPFKKYPEAELLPLPAPQESGGPSLWAVLKGRRSHRRFTGTPLALADLSQLLWAAQGITRRTRGFGFRAAPSAGALYPVETYVVAREVTDMAAGVYHYNIPRHALDRLRAGDFSRDLARAALDQAMVSHAPVTFAWTAVVARSKWKYLQRAYRYVYLDAGHLAENLMLAAEGLGLGSCGIGAIYDEEVNQILEVDGSAETAVYLCVVGHLPSRLQNLRKDEKKGR